jgi:hypothetical protein
MRLNSKVTWGLAWTGLALVLAVPSADYLTGQFGRDARNAAVLTSDVEPVKTAAIEPTAPAKSTKVTTVKTDKGIKIVPAGTETTAANSNDPVDKYLKSGKKLPSYISDGDAPATVDTQVATVNPDPVAPRMPLPASARPKSFGPPAPTAPATAAAPAETLVIVDEDTLTGSLAKPAGPVPPSPIVDDTSNWEDESLRQYLQRRGILEGGDDDRSTATVTRRDGTYDPDGFYLNEGPNSDRTSRETRRQRILRMLEENDGGDFELF